VPVWAAADPTARFLYVSDYAAAVVYVVDINPSDAKYHQVVARIHLPTAPVDATRHEIGLREIALSSDGRRLFVTAPDKTYPGGVRQPGAQVPPGQVDSKIFVIDTDLAEEKYFLTVLGEVQKDPNADLDDLLNPNAHPDPDFDTFSADTDNDLALDSG